MGIFGNTFGLPHLIIILVIILLLFGAPKLPGLARSVGQSMKIFRSEIKSDKKDDAPDDSASANSASARSGATNSGATNSVANHVDADSVAPTQSKTEL